MFDVCCKIQCVDNVKLSGTKTVTDKTPIFEITKLCTLDKFER